MSSCNKSLLQKGIICTLMYIFSTRTFVLNAVKEPVFFIFCGGRGWVRANKSLLDCESMG